MSNAQLLARRFSKIVTKAIAVRWGENFPFYYVSEYPKSGGTWLSQMLGDYLQVPVPRRSIFPIGFEAVILNHWPYDPRLRGVSYIYRDGRDVLTSFFFHRLRIARTSSDPRSRRVRKHLLRLFGEQFEEREAGSLLAQFIDHEFCRPAFGSRLNWRDHIARWYAPTERPHIAYLRYEDLLLETTATLSKVIELVTGQPAEPDRVQSTASKFSMEAQTGRRPGEESTEHHVRKGIAGDWKNHFTRECAEIFHRHAGETLIALGYESDDRWIDRAFPGERRPR